MIPMIPIKTKKEIEIMKKGGRIAARVKKRLAQAVQPGINTAQLNKLAEELIRGAGAVPSFKGYNNFPAAIVTCVNEEAVHGIPSARRLEKGDLLTIDLGVYYCGFHTDTAVSVLVDAYNFQFSPRLRSPLVRAQRAHPSESRTGQAIFNFQLFLETGQQALENAINQCRPGNNIGDVSYAIKQTIEKAEYNVIRTFVGHGVGRDLHEPPQIPCFGKKGEGEKIKAGMTLAVEVMYVQGSPELKLLSDDWTTVTKDGKLSAMFEETVAVTEENPVVLTKS